MWADTNSPLAQYIEARNAKCLESYRVNPDYIEEHCNHEREVAQGGYSQRQIYELIQNGADALQGRNDGRIEVVLTNDALYCANEGEPIDEEGAKAILTAYLSNKRGAQIGRFGLGLKPCSTCATRPNFTRVRVRFAFPMPTLWSACAKFCLRFRWRRRCDWLLRLLPTRKARTTRFCAR